MSKRRNKKNLKGKEPGKSPSRRYWLDRRREFLDSKDLLKRYLMKRAFVGFAWAAHTMCKDEADYFSANDFWEYLERSIVFPNISRSTCYHYLEILDKVGILDIKYDGRITSFRYNRKVRTWEHFEHELLEAVTREGFFKSSKHR